MSNSINWDMYDDIIAECKELGQRKNKDYGTKSLTMFGGMSIVIRINDKVQRINNLYETTLNDDKPNPFNPTQVETPFVDESIDDTLMDLINYTTYLLILRNGGIK